jgi:hypothetical protein
MSDFIKTFIFSTDFQKIKNIKFYENISSGSQVVSYGRTDGGTQTNMTNLIVAFRYLVKAPKNE